MNLFLGIRKFFWKKELNVKKNEKLRASKKPELEVPHLDEMKEIENKIYDLNKVNDLLEEHGFKAIE